VDQAKYFIVTETAEDACAEALNRYIHDLGGVDTCIELMQELEFDLTYHPEFFSKIPGAPELMFVVTVTGVPSDESS